MISTADVPEDHICEDSTPARSPNQETTTSSSSLVAEPPCTLVSSFSTASSHLLDSLQLPRSIDRMTIQELLIQFHGLLKITGLETVASLLKSELETKGLIPQRYAFDGRPRPQTLENFQSQFRTYGTDLLQVLSKLNERTNAIIPPCIANLSIRLFSGPQNSLIREKINSKRLFTLNSTISRPHIKSLETCKSINVLTARELGMPISTRFLQRKQACAEINDHGRFQGHMMSVFCVTFDQSGRYVLTGGDDKIIKVWDTVYGRLRYTFRGHVGEVTDMSINAENNCLASGSNDKTVRVWNTGNGQQLTVFKKHTAIIGMVNFTDFVDGDTRYLVSIGNDCMVAFYRYNISTLTFDLEPIRFEEREVPSARSLALNCSFGGNFVVMGDSSNAIHIYKLSASTVDRLAEFRAHEDRVDSLVFSNSHLRFASGSRDGIAKVWEFSSGEWVSTELRVSDRPEQSIRARCSQQTTRKNNSYTLTMLNWSGDDTKLITTGSDYLVRVWDWKSGQMLIKMEGHTNQVFVLRPHPIHVDLMFTAGHDGLLLLWDISTGEILWKHKNQLDLHAATHAIFDVAISPQGDRLAYVDTNGTLTLMGMGENRMSKEAQEQQFFSTDYDELFLDERGFAHDIEGIPEHLALPPLLVNGDINAYAAEYQRHVPGRDYSDPNRVQNPWNTRKILPSVPIKEFALDQMERSRIELAEYEAGKPLDVAEIQKRRELEKERQRQAHLDRLEKQRNQRRNRQELTEQMYQQLTQQPRYVIDDTFTDSDSTYSEGNDQQVAAEDLGESDLSSKDLYEDFDSDYEEGRIEQPTVFRNRSAVTVTGRRKKNIQIRRSTNNDSQQLPEDQPSTSQASIQRTTRYGRQTKPPPRIEQEYPEADRAKRRAAASISAPAESTTVRHITRSRRAQLSSESPRSESQPKTVGTRNRGGMREPNKRTTSSTSESIESVMRESEESPDLEALDEEIEENNSIATTPEPEDSLSISSTEEEEDFKPRRKQNTRPSPKQRRRPSFRKIDASPSRSRMSSVSDSKHEYGKEIGTTSQVGKVLRSGRESRPPRILGEDENMRISSSSRRIRSYKLSSPQRRSDRLSKHHYNFHYDSKTPSPGSSCLDYSTMRSRSTKRRQQNGLRYSEVTDGEGSLSPVPDPSYATASSNPRKPKKKARNPAYPEWMFTTEKRRFPYIAQLGDRVVYFVQGHQNYINETRFEVEPDLEKEMQMFSSEENFVVADIDYKEKLQKRKNEWVLVQVVTLVHLQNGKPDGRTFNFCFHDQENCPDFIILKQHYDKSRAFDFKRGDQVEMVLDDSVYTGRVENHQCFDPNYSSSEWNAMVIAWYDEVDRCSIWDLQPSKPNRALKDPVTSEDIEELGKYEPEREDWPVNQDESLSSSRSRYLDRCVKAINELAELEQIAPFVDMVNLEDYQDYPSMVFRPMYLQLIVDRIRQMYYRSLSSLKFDIKLIAQNTHIFNEPDSDISYNCDLLVSTLFKVLEDFTASPTAYFLELAGSEEIPPPIEKLIPPVLMGAHLNIEAGGPSTSNSSTSTVADSWKSQCKSMIDNLICTHLANQQTSLRSHIDDLCTIMQKGEFGSPGDFKDALKEALNEEGSDMGKKERRYIELTRLMNDLDKQFDSIISQYQRAQNVHRTRHQTPTSSSNTTETYNLRRSSRRPEFLSTSIQRSSRRTFERSNKRSRFYEEEDDDDFEEPSTSRSNRKRSRRYS